MTALVRCDQCQREQDSLIGWIHASREEVLRRDELWQRVDETWDFCSPACVTIWFAALVAEEDPAKTKGAG